MTMRDDPRSRRRAWRVVPALLLLVGGSAAADSFGGFSGVDRPYLVNADKVCTPLKVTNGTATGVPACAKVAADAVAKLSMKTPTPQGGAKSTFAATAAGRTITVMRKQAGTQAVRWNATDSVGRIVEVYASQYDDRVAVVYTTKRLGKEVTDVVAFDFGLGAASTQPPPTTAPPPTTTPAPTGDPKLVKAVAVARKASKAKAVAAWRAVLVLDADHSEARYQIAAAQAAKQPAEALATLGALAASTRADAIEWLIAARFDRAFAGLRGDAKFRTAVALDRKPATPYERLMWLGGQWEQTGTSCDKAEVRFNAYRDRTFKLRVKTTCQGSVFDTPFKGTWRFEGDRIVLTVPTKGRQVTAQDEAGCSFEVAGDEDAMRCTIGRDIDFTVLPARR